ncbi:MAG: NAD(P)/FAD-dependent oxidoreductase [Candidatus Bathyarchaeia archaeon]|nr:NAD(P)/FAD-dependent oxidoreductase [Candidatus Bathyarchaeota archaeon]
MPDTYDLVVVGAGTAGCTAASKAARMGLKVCLIDCKPKVKIGEKVCGDAIGSHHFDELKIPHPKGDELDSKMVGVKIYSPDLSSVFVIDGPGVSGYMVDRYNFGQRLLKDATDSGAELVDSTLVIGPNIENNTVKGVITQSQGRRRVLKAKVTIDASGVAATIRRSLPEGFNVEREVSRRDLMVCYREVRSNVEIEQGYCHIYLNQKVARGGYFWIFPRSNGEVNVGVGVQANIENPNPKAQLYKHILNKPIFKDSKVQDAGGGTVPTRRPLDCLVGDGVMFIGDAACLVNPIHGGGIGPSMISGAIAAQVAAEALEKNDATSRGLWNYNLKYMAAYGAKQAGLDVFRIFLQSLTDEELNYGMAQKLVMEDDVLKASLEGDLNLSLTDKAGRILRNIGRLRFLLRLREVSNRMRRVKTHFLNYPSPEEFPSWREKLKTLY